MLTLHQPTMIHHQSKQTAEEVTEVLVKVQIWDGGLMRRNMRYTNFPTTALRGAHVVLTTYAQGLVDADDRWIRGVVSYLRDYDRYGRDDYLAKILALTACDSNAPPLRSVAEPLTFFSSVHAVSALSGRGIERLLLSIIDKGLAVRLERNEKPHPIVRVQPPPRHASKKCTIC
eukprot:TRINITY_DN10949_c0_g1_i2.p1 TRINITY_DN10949_c0_g1~~TRINITY_DN10949_c0_g1_i2.p1  ORF type:complete len:174 (+),score=8.81 TRINITY_DN10949_c0_g1_i2:210-731(+)